MRSWYHCPFAIMKEGVHGPERGFTVPGRATRSPDHIGVHPRPVQPGQPRPAAAVQAPAGLAGDRRGHQLAAARSQVASEGETANATAAGHRPHSMKCDDIMADHGFTTTLTGGRTSQPGAGSWTPRLWGILFVLGGALCLDALDVSMVGVALPSIRTAPGLSTASLQWIVSGTPVPAPAWPSRHAARQTRASTRRCRRAAAIRSLIVSRPACQPRSGNWTPWRC
jgi:hypothetical protein